MKLNTSPKTPDYFLICILLFRGTLDFLYVFVLGDYYRLSYLLSSGVFKVDININKYVISWIVYLVFAVFINKKILITKNKASEIIILGLFCMSFTPSISLFALSNIRYEYFYYLMLFWSLLLLSVLFFSKIRFKQNTNTVKVVLNEKSKYIIWMGIVLIFSFGTIALSWKINGLRPSITLDSVKIYELRGQVSAANLGTLFEYFRNNAMFVAIPFAAIYAFKRKKVIFFSFLCVIQLLLYGIDNQKAALFIIPASILAYVFYRKKMISFIPMALTVINCIIYVEAVIGKTYFLVSSLLERIYYLPAILSNCYFDYFYGSPKVVPFIGIFQKMGFVTNYPYSDGVPYLIGGQYFHNPEISANTGMFGSAFSYGLAGIIIIPFAYAFLFYLFDKVTTNIEIRSIISILIVQVFVITGAAFFVVLTVYGFILALIMIALVNGNRKFN